MKLNCCMWEMWTRDASQSWGRKKSRWFDLRLQPTSFGVFNWFWVFTSKRKLQNHKTFFSSGVETDKCIRQSGIDKWQKMLFTVFQEGTIWSNWMIWQERIVNQFLWLLPCRCESASMVSEEQFLGTGARFMSACLSCTIFGARNK